MSFEVISNIFCDFSLERDQPTDQPTNQPTDRGSYRGAMAHLKTARNSEMLPTVRPNDMARCSLVSATKTSDEG